MKTSHNKIFKRSRIATPLLALLVLLFAAPMAQGQNVSSNGSINIVADSDGLNNDGDIRFKAGPDTRMLMQDNGNFGLGTTNPLAPLHVQAVGGDPSQSGLYVMNPNGSSSVVAARVSGVTGNPLFSWDIFGVGGWSMGIDNADGDKLKIGRDWVDISEGDVMVFDKFGNLGLGTANPEAQLHLADIYGAGGKNLLIGDDVFLSDIDRTDMLGIWGNGNYNRGGIQLGNGGPELWGSSGKLGIGTDSPTSALHVKGNGTSGTIRISPDVNGGESSIGFYENTDGSTGDFWVAGQGSWANWGDFVIGRGGSQMLIQPNGNLGIGTDSPQARLHVNGEARFAGNVLPQSSGSYNLGSGSNRWNTVYTYNSNVSTSDRRDKNSIQKLAYGLEEVLAMRPVTYKWNEMPDHGTQVGFIAQELNEVAPDIVFDPKEELQLDEEGNWIPVPVTEASRFGIQYALLTPILVKAMQEQQGQIEAQQAQLDQQEERIADLLSKQNQTGSTKARSTFDELGVPALYQNVPNPFDEVTEIRYFLPQTVQRATLYIYDMSGNPVLETAITEKGQGTFVLNGSMLSAGMYLYALIADGQEVDVKRMILAKGN